MLLKSEKRKCCYLRRFRQCR